MQWSEMIHRKGKNTKLTLNLTPNKIQFKSLFQVYVKSKKLKEWTKIKRELLVREGAQCWICGRESLNLHIQEFWHYDDDNHLLNLQEIHHVCDLCHKIKRTDLWFFTEYGKEQLKQLDLCWEDLIKHYCKVNKCSLKVFAVNWREAIQTWKSRNIHEWQIDFGVYEPRKDYLT